MNPEFFSKFGVTLSQRELLTGGREDVSRRSRCGQETVDMVEEEYGLIELEMMVPKPEMRFRPAIFGDVTHFDAAKREEILGALAEVRGETREAGRASGLSDWTRAALRCVWELNEPDVVGTTALEALAMLGIDDAETVQAYACHVHGLRFRGVPGAEELLQANTRLEKQVQRKLEAYERLSLKERIESREWSYRVCATRGLAREHRVTELVEMVKDDAPAVVHATLKELSELGPAAKDGAQDEIIWLLEGKRPLNGSPFLVVEAVEALGRMGVDSERGVELILQVADCFQVDEYVLRQPALHTRDFLNRAFKVVAAKPMYRRPLARLVGHAPVLSKEHEECLTEWLNTPWERSQGRQQEEEIEILAALSEHCCEGHDGCWVSDKDCVARVGTEGMPDATYGERVIPRSPVPVYGGQQDDDLPQGTMGSSGVQRTGSSTNREVVYWRSGLSLGGEESIAYGETAGVLLPDYDETGMRWLHQRARVAGSCKRRRAAWCISAVGNRTKSSNGRVNCWHYAYDLRTLGQDEYAERLFNSAEVQSALVNRARSFARQLREDPLDLARSWLSMFLVEEVFPKKIDIDKWEKPSLVAFFVTCLYHALVDDLDAKNKCPDTECRRVAETVCSRGISDLVLAEEMTRQGEIVAEWSGKHAISETFRLRYREGMNCKTIAEVLGVAPRTILRQLKKVRAELKRLGSPHGDLVCGTQSTTDC